MRRSLPHTGQTVFDGDSYWCNSCCGGWRIRDTRSDNSRETQQLRQTCMPNHCNKMDEVTAQGGNTTPGLSSYCREIFVITEKRISTIWFPVSWSTYSCEDCPCRRTILHNLAFQVFGCGNPHDLNMGPITSSAEKPQAQKHALIRYSTLQDSISRYCIIIYLYTKTAVSQFIDLGVEN